MSLTLGEKLRQAREERGFTVSEVAEQTRISSLYLQSIENDDYRILPGGIFNKGFVKSYAKFVGVNEQEALLDYSQILAESDNVQDELKHYKPEVLTDDRSSGSMVLTIVVATMILGLMTVGILYGVSYLRAPSEPTVVNTTTKTNTNSSNELAANTNSAPALPVPADMPDMSTLKVEFSVANQPVTIDAVSDNTKSKNDVKVGSPVTFEPKESLTVNYNKWNADKLQLTINGKSITLPSEPLNPKDKRIEFTISKDNLAQIWTNGAIATEVAPATPVAPDANAGVETPLANTTNQPVPIQTPVRTIPTPKPAVPANTAPSKTTDPKPANTAKPPAPPVKPPANGL